MNQRLEIERAAQEMAREAGVIVVLQVRVWGKNEAQLVGIIDDWDIFSICRNPIMGQSKLNGRNEKKNIEAFPMPALTIATKPIK